MAEIINSITVDKGNRVSFNTLNTSDPRSVWLGIVNGFVDYDLAKGISDVDNYQNQILKINPAAPNIRDAKFIVITLDPEADSPSKRVAFALPWMETISFQILDAVRSVDFRVYGITDAKIPIILQILTEAGFRVKPVV